ncbi:MAG: hypothetical protein ACLRFE_03365 [Clostridia bacterium]
MLKWIIIAIVIVLMVFAIMFIKFMLKTEKDSKKQVTEKVEPAEEYNPETKPVDIHSASSSIPITDMSNKSNNTKADQDFINDIMSDFDIPTSNGFIDAVDDEFADYSDFARKSKNMRNSVVDFDLDGDMADEYIPDSPEFSYLPRRQPRSMANKPVDEALNELPTELKVLMLSDIFDRKFFD